MQSGYGYYYTGEGKTLERKDIEIGAPGPGEAIVKVAGCGLCHTDLGFISGAVKTRSAPPIIPGHEVSGEVVEVGAEYAGLVGKRVVVPAVLPCGECDLCKGGRSNICRKQLMPGNDMDGGFASHMKVPARFLCKLPDDLGKMPLSALAVVADAISTPYQALLRSGLGEGDLAVVIGVGGIGIYMAQLARDAGATVIAIDIDEDKLENARKMGIPFTINAREKSEKEIREEVRALAKEKGLPRFLWKVFETSGAAAGQQAAFSLLTFGGVVGVVGFTMDKVSVRLSNLMAFDGDMFGNWGCKPEHYPAIVEKVLRGDINVVDNVEEHPLDSANDVLALAFDHKLKKRVVFVP